MKRLLTLLACLASPFLFAQHWSDLMGSDELTNIYEIKSSFDAQYSEQKANQKASGYKQFNRWFWMMEQRCYPSGELFDPSMAWKERMQFLAKSTAAGSSNWKSLGPDNWNSYSYNPGAGRVNYVEVDPNDSSIIYVGVPSGGLWKSIDAGATWDNLTDDLPILGVSAILVDPNNSDHLYIGTGDGDGYDTYSIGILESFDGGVSWNPTGLSWNVTQFRVVRKIVMHPNSADTLWAATSSGLYFSGDAGVTWTSSMTGSIRDIELKPGDPSVVYACTDQFFRSTNYGQSFSQVFTGLPSASQVNRMAIAVSEDDPSVVYGLFGAQSGSSFYGLYKSNNEGTSWAWQSNSPNIFGYAIDGNDNSGISWYGMALEANPKDADQIFAGSVNVWKSSDGGKNWDISSHWVYPSSTGYTHADIHYLGFHDDKLYCGSDGGVFSSLDTGDTWVDHSKDLRIMQFYRMSASATDPYIISGGAQDNGTNVRTADSNNLTWTHIMGADGMETIIHPNNPDIIYHTTQYGSLRKSTDGGISTSSCSQGIAESGAWVTPWVMHPTNPDIMYAGFESLYITYDGATTWSPLDPGFSAGTTIRALAVAPSDANYIYLAAGSTIRMTPDDGITWSNISTGLPNESITYIAISNSDPKRLWVTLSGYTGGEKVYFSPNGGQTWTNISGNLPNLPVNCIAYQNGTQGGLYVGTDVGIYYTNDTLGTWVDFSEGLPNVIVNELEIHYGINKIRAATFGRGMWESDLFNLPNNVGIAEAYSKEVNIYPIPAKENLTIDLIENPINVSLINALGQEVRRIEQPKKRSLQLDISNLRGGSYILRIAFESGIYAEEILVN